MTNTLSTTICGIYDGEHGGWMVLKSNEKASGGSSAPKA